MRSCFRQGVAIRFWLAAKAAYEAMQNHVGANLMRLMAAANLSIYQVAEQTNLDLRTIRSILNGRNRPQTRSLHRLAAGLGVSVDELFVDPARLLHRCFDRQTNPVVDEVVQQHGHLFDHWTEADFDELHSRMGTGGALTREGTLAVVEAMNRKRELHDQLDLLLETGHAEIIAAIITAMYEKVVV